MHFLQSSVRACTQHSWRIHLCRVFFVTLTLLVVLPVPQAYAWQGAGTKIFLASSTFLAAEDVQKNFGAGPDIPLSQSENAYMCSLQKMFPVNAADSLIEWFAVEIARILGRDPAMVTSVLKDRTFCRTRELPLVSRKADVIVRLNAKGVVVSTNPVWNACVSGENLTLDLIKSNTDIYMHRQANVSKKFAMTCRDYHRGNVSMWQHPDYPDLEIQLDHKGRLVGGLPFGFTAKKDSVQKNVASQ